MSRNLCKDGIMNIFAFVIMILLFSIATYLLYIANFAKVQINKNLLTFKGNKAFSYQDKKSFLTFIKENNVQNRNFTFITYGNGKAYSELAEFIMSKGRQFEIKPYFSLCEEQLKGKKIVKIPLKFKNLHFYTFV